MQVSPIDLSTGTVTLDSVRVGPDFGRSDFLASPLGAKRQEMVANEPYHSWKVSADVGGHAFLAALSFKGEDLRELSLALNEGRTSTSWADWSEEEELAIKDAHEQWLRDACGVTVPASFDWGEIVSVYDPKGAFSHIIIDYRANLSGT